MSTTTTDRIEKQIVLRAPRPRVWKALADSQEFGTWFKAALDGPFATGARVGGHVTHPGYEHVRMDLQIERMEPERRFAFRWHPNAVEPGVDYSNEPTTLVEFTLEDVEGGTRLTVTESGFDAIPLARRAEAIKGNDRGWTGQMKAIEAYLQRTP